MVAMVADNELVVDILVVEVTFGETIYSCKPLGPPQNCVESPAHFMLQRPSVAGALPPAQCCSAVTFSAIFDPKVFKLRAQIGTLE